MKADQKTNLDLWTLVDPDDLLDAVNAELTHFQSHYLPDGYQNRLHYLDRYHLLDVYLVDALDIFTGKLFSRREKDIDDLRLLKSSFAREDILTRMNNSAASLLSDPQFRSNAQRNGYILSGDALPA